MSGQGVEQTHSDTFQYRNNTGWEPPGLRLRKSYNPEPDWGKTSANLPPHWLEERFLLSHGRSVNSASHQCSLSCGDTLISHIRLTEANKTLNIKTDWRNSSFLSSVFSPSRDRYFPTWPALVEDKHQRRNQIKFPDSIGNLAGTIITGWDTLLTSFFPDICFVIRFILPTSPPAYFRLLHFLLLILPFQKLSVFIHHLSRKIGFLMIKECFEPKNFCWNFLTFICLFENLKIVKIFIRFYCFYERLSFIIGGVLASVTTNFRIYW